LEPVSLLYCPTSCYMGALQCWVQETLSFWGISGILRGL